MTLYVADYSWARPDPHALAAAGYTGVMRYVCPLPDGKGKIIDAAEYQALEGAGLTVVLNFEWSQTRALGGFQAGVEDARVADAQADAVGYPAWRPIYFSVDTAATAAQVNAYFQGVCSTLKRPVGVYGGTNVVQPLLDAGSVKYGWLANAASWSGVTAWSAIPHGSAHLIQHLDHPLGFAGQIDHNDVLRPDWAGSQGSGDEVLDPSDPIVGELRAAALRVTDMENRLGKLDAVYNAVFDFNTSSGLATINTHVVNVAAALAKLVATPAGGAVDVSALTTAIQALPHEVVVELAKSLPTQ